MARRVFLFHSRGACLNAATAMQQEAAKAGGLRHTDCAAIARRLRSWIGQVAVEADLCSMPVDSAGNYKNFFEVVGVSAGLAQQERSALEAILRRTPSIRQP
jgi:hypothetical protein